MMPDGERRGGFARLAAVVKAERAQGANVIFAMPAIRCRRR